MYQYTLQNEYGVFDSPRKTVYSPYHQKIIVMGDYTIYSFDPVSSQKNVIQTSLNNFFSDMDVSADGNLLLLFRPDSSGEAVARIFEPDLFRIAYDIIIIPSGTTQWQFQKGIFCGAGIAVIAGELVSVAPPIVDDNSSSSSSGGTSSSGTSSSSSQSSSSSSSSIINANTIRFYTVNYQQKTVTTCDVRTNGSVVGMGYYQPENAIYAATSKQGILCLNINAGIATEIGSVNIGGSGGSGAVETTAAAFGSQDFSIQSPIQEAARIYVGSKPWASDRWDSGIINTANTTISYGGGDNLVPGQTYWVHIVIKINNQWSAPQIKSFSVPK